MEPLYKVGDKVLVITRTEESREYRFSFIDEMTSYTGRVVTIASVSMPKDIDEKVVVPDDGYRYNILEDNGEFVWASSMFCPIITSTMSQASDTPITIKIKIKQLKFNFKN